MVSDRKIAANQRNSRRSSGPRSAAGKLTVSRNALRHGLAAATLRDSGIAAEVDRLATAIAGENEDAVQREQALIIAESEITLLRVRAVRTSIFEQMLLAMGAAGPQEPSEQLLGRLHAGVIGGSHFEQLRRLERYERRAFSRRQGAIRILLDGPSNVNRMVRVPNRPSRPKKISIPDVGHRRESSILAVRRADVFARDGDRGG